MCPPLSEGRTLNQAAPARLVESWAIVTTLVSSPQSRPLMYWVCCMRSSPESIVLVAPFCADPGGRAQVSDAITVLDSLGSLPCWSAVRSVIAQTPRRWSVVPVGSSELRKYSAFGAPVLIAGCTD